MARCVAAYTDPTGSGYPPYLNISDMGEEGVRVIVRSPAGRDEQRMLTEGPSASITLPREVAITQLRDALEGLAAL